MPRTTKRKASSTTSKTVQPKVYCLWCGCGNQAKFYSTKDPHRAFFGKIPYCKDCIRKIFAEYKTKCKDNINLALYYTLRKIDVPYVYSAYTGALENLDNQEDGIQDGETLVGTYLKGMGFSELNGWGNSFDDTKDEKYIDGLEITSDVVKVRRRTNMKKESNEEYDIIELDADELVQKWGQFDDEDLAYLESEYMDWSEQLNGVIDKSLDIIIKQICLQCNEIRKDRQDGLPVEKKIVALQNLMKAGNLNDIQSKEDRPTSVGMNLSDIEFRRPIRQCDPELEDVDRVKKILDAYLGGTSKALGKDNAFTRRFDDEYAAFTIDTIDNLKNSLNHVDLDTNEEESDDEVDGDSDADSNDSGTT